jgi:hypothetical protein
VSRKTYYHLSLSLPYIALLIAGALTYWLQGPDLFSSTSSPGILSGVLLFFTVSAVLWAPLYTWMVVVMLLWGRGRKTAEIRRLYLLSPALLACAMGFPALLVGMPGSGIMMLWGILHMSNLDFLMPVFFDNYSVEQSLTVVLAWAFMAALCIVIGYAFVGSALLVERMMSKRGLFIEEDEDLSHPVVTGSVTDAEPGSGNA